MTTELASNLRRIADEIECGDYEPVVEAILVTRDMATNILTFHCWGENTGVLNEAYEIKKECDKLRAIQ